jgi:hypothetical protein
MIEKSVGYELWIQPRSSNGEEFTNQDLAEPG